MCILENLRITQATKRRLEGELQRAEKLGNLRLYKIARALLLLEENRPVSGVARLLHVSSRTLYDWVDRFILQRFSWLSSLHFRGRGRKPKLTGKQKDALHEIIVQGPEKAGYDCGAWNSPMIAQLIQQRFNVTYNPRYLCALLRDLGLSYQKAAFVSDRVEDPEHIKALRRWRCVTWPAIRKQARRSGGVILFADEVSFAQWGSLAKTWAPRGVQPKIKTSGKRKGLKIFGAIEFHRGDFVYQECPEKFNGESYLRFLEHLLRTQCH